MPLTPLQAEILTYLSAQRTPSSYLAGAAGLLMSRRSPRHSQDVDLFHDTEEAVARAFAEDRVCLEGHGFHISVVLSQPGFIRAEVGRPTGHRVRIDWGHDSCWRFFPPVLVDGAGYVLHPIDLAVNKVLALAGRDEARDFIDILYLSDRVLPLGALAWAAAGKDPGLNPVMIMDFLARKGRLHQRDLDRLDLVRPIRIEDAVAQYRHALSEGKAWIETRPPEEAGCLYRNPASNLFFAPRPGDACVVHRGAPGGVWPLLVDGQSYRDDPSACAELESFFERRVNLHPEDM